MKKSLILILFSAILLLLASCAPLPWQTAEDPNNRREEEPKEPGEDPVSLSLLLPWISTVTENDIASVKLETGFVGVNPATAVPTILRSEDPRDISYNLSYLKNATVAASEHTLLGGRYRTLTLFFKNGEEKTVTIINGFVRIDNELHYALDGYTDVFPKIEFFGEP